MSKFTPLYKDSVRRLLDGSIAKNNNGTTVQINQVLLFY